MIDENHKLWIIEINCFPSFNYFITRNIIDETTKKRIKIKQVSEIDKYIKTLIIKEAIQVIRGEYEESDKVFQQIYPPKDTENYKNLNIYDNIRKVFENLAYPQKPDYINLDQFETIGQYGEEMKHIGQEDSKSPEDGRSLTNEIGASAKLDAKILTKTLLRNYFKDYAKSGKQTLMNLSQFTKAIDALATTLYPGYFTKYERMSRIMEDLFHMP